MFFAVGWIVKSSFGSYLFFFYFLKVALVQINDNHESSSKNFSMSAEF